MDNGIPDLDSISRQLINSNRPRKPKMLVVDDEPDNLDLLYRTFRREFNVLRAESGASALSVLATEGEVAVIISDQRMPEMKGTEFLSKTVPRFPDTMRIILTGFTDVEDLVEAINSGQVYRYITKPWNPNELKGVVQNAAQTYELLKQRSEEQQRAQAQIDLLATIMQVAQSCDSRESCLKPIAKAFSDSFFADCCILQLLEDNKLTTARGIYKKFEISENFLEKDPLVQEALTHQQPMVWVDSTSAPSVVELEHYQREGIQAHLLIPIIYREQLLAMLSLQWQHTGRLAFTSLVREDELKLIYLLAQQVGLVLDSRPVLVNQL
ncbi:MAG: response regulator [Symploca sp. SIO2E9]|nr:response regulator [Symploca sp. SIO2E9]